MHVIENDQSNRDSLSTILLDSNISWIHFSFATLQLITETENCTTFYMFDGRASPDRVSLLLICDTWISSRMSVIHTCHHGHCCHLKHPSLLHDIKVSTTRTSSLSFIHYIHCSSFTMTNGVNQGHVQNCSLLQAIHPFTATLWRDKVYLIIGSHNVQLDLNTLFHPNPFTFTLNTPYFPMIKYHTAMSINTACWHGLILLTGLTKWFQRSWLCH